MSRKFRFPVFRMRRHRTARIVAKKNPKTGRKVYYEIVGDPNKFGSWKIVSKAKAEEIRNA